VTPVLPLSFLTSPCSLLSSRFSPLTSLRSPLPIGIARVNRHLHQRADGIVWIPEVLGEVGATCDVVIRERLPLPGCRRVRAPRRRKASGRTPDGWCAAKRETFVGWRVHLVRRPDGAPVRVPMQPTPPNPSHG